MRQSVFPACGQPVEIEAVILVGEETGMAVVATLDQLFAFVF